MVMSEGEQIILAIIVGTLAAIVYSLRILVLVERRIARVDANMEKIVNAVLKEEIKIEREEQEIEKKILRKK